MLATGALPYTTEAFGGGRNDSLTSDITLGLDFPRRGRGETRPSTCVTRRSPNR